GLFIDYDNADQYFPDGGLAGRIGNWLAWLEDGRFDSKGRRRKFLEKRVYWHPRHQLVEAAFAAHGFKTKACAAIAQGKRGKSAVDLHLAVESIEAAAYTRGLKEIIVIAGDSDYAPLLERLKARGVATCIVYDGRPSSAIYLDLAALTLERP